ncbi:MAG: bifunctional ornithine acetyltransferase/N-acetylglutamate synthase [Candidatus Limnocylindrales bacterium]
MPDILSALAQRLPASERRAILPGGFVAGGATAGIKASGRPDLAIVASAGGPLAAAAVFTPNAFAAAPVRRSKAVLESSGGWIRAVVSTSGSANAATGAAGDADQVQVGTFVAGALGIDAGEVLHLSTGIIGTRLPLDRVGPGIAALGPLLAASDEAFAAAAEALRTTDSVTKAASVRLELLTAHGAPVAVTVSGVAKGVGMIHPRMATMLAIVVTDAAASPEVLAGILRAAAARTWDQLSVDGDTSTNDTVFLLASGASGAAPVEAGSPGATSLGAAVEAVARDLARQQASDGEGATCLLTCQVTGAAHDPDARAVARAVISSSLVKAAAHGKDPNWGRIAGAAGNARLADAAILEAGGLAPDDAARLAGTAATVSPDTLRIAIAGHLVFDGSLGGPQAFDKAAASAAMGGPEILIRLDLGLGEGTGEAFGCDLTEAYVIENSEYTT